MSRDLVKMADGDEMDQRKEEKDPTEISSWNSDENTDDIDSIVDECSQGKTNAVICHVP